MTDQEFSNWQTQLHKGYLELCVLLALQRRQPSFGAELISLFAKEGLSVNEGTLYPLLNRMQRNGWLETEWQLPESKGHPRRLYRLNPDCAGRIDEMLETFNKNHESIGRLSQKWNEKNL